MWPLFQAAFAAARVVFLYRKLDPWAQSFHRMVQAAGVMDPTARLPVAWIHDKFGRFSARLDQREFLTPLENLAILWLGSMESCLWMQRAGLPMFLVRYEELSAAPHAVLAAMFAHSGLEAGAVANLNAVLDQDSQAGTWLSRESLGKVVARLDAEQIGQLR